MARFVILVHDGPRGLHYDLMLERGEVLKTWSLPQPPDTAGVMDCRLLPDHRLAYLDYEGPISGERGSVTQWDQGTCEIGEQSQTHWSAELHGGKLEGSIALTQKSGESSANSDNAADWTFRYVAQA